MNDLRTLLSDVADEVTPADLAPRVTAGLRRRARRRRATVAAFSVVVLGLAAVGASALLGDRRRAGLIPTNGDEGFELVWMSVVQHGAQWNIRAQGADGPRHDLGIVSEPISEYDISPDGTRIAYSTRDGIAVVELTEGVPVSHFAVPGQPGPTEAQPVWSPDSKKVLYRKVSTRTQGLSYDGFSIVDTETGAVTTVDYPHGPEFVSWSPDGTMVALTPLTGGIDLVALDGRRLNGFGQIGWRLASPHAWSPDGSRVIVHITTELSDGRQPVRTVVTTPTPEGPILTELPLGSRFWVWRDAEHVARIKRFTVEEYAMDGTMRPTLEMDLGGTGLRDPLLRPAS